MASHPSKQDHASAAKEAEAAATIDATSIEVGSTEPEANKLFRMVMKHKGSDLHLKVGLPPCMRLAGVLRQMALPPLTTAEMERLMFPLLSPRTKQILEDEGGCDFAHIVYDGKLETRFRVNLFRARGRLSLVARRVNNNIPNFESLRPAAGHRRAAVQLRAGDHHLRRRDRVGQDHQHRLDASVHQ